MKTNLTVSEILGKHPSLIIGTLKGEPIFKPETVEVERQINELLREARVEAIASYKKVLKLEAHLKQTEVRDENNNV